MDNMDWSFLYEPDGINKMVDDLFSFRILLLRNEDEDVCVLKIMNQLQLSYILKEHLLEEDDIIQMIIKNGRNDISCPYFKFVFKLYGESQPINYKLESFFRATGIFGIHARCKVALVIGLMNDQLSESCVDVPLEYYYTSVKPVSFLDGIDTTQNPNIGRNKCLDKLQGITGMSLPVPLPKEVHWTIFKYLRHPCAQLILDHFNQVRAWAIYWDSHFVDMIFRAATW